MKIRMSLFTKLFLVIIAAGAVVNILVGGFFRYQFVQGTRAIFRKNVGLYADYLTGRIGAPPDLARAREVAHDTQLEISIAGPGVTWATAAIPESAYRDGGVRRSGNARFIFRGGTFLLETDRGGYRYRYFSTGMPVQWEEKHVIALIILLSAALIGAYALIRRILRPVTLLTRGVREIAGGNLDYEVPVRSGDELGELSASFNIMEKRLKDMIRSREQLLLDVSHELRSPLTRVKVELEFVEDEKLRGAIGEDIREIEGMITEILETERLKYLQVKMDTGEVDIVALIDEAAASMDLNAGALRIEERQGRLAVRGDRAWLKIVVRNILENATKHSNPAEVPIDIAFREGDGYTSVVITDHGSGIPRDEIPFLFEPFYRVDASRSRKTGGYGLGLSLCKKIMDAHGGAINIQSAPGEGTSVIITFRT